MTTILANGVQVADEDLPIWEDYNYSCVIHPNRYAVCLHEEPPKSLNPHWRTMPETRFPVCNECHILVHNLGRKDAGILLVSSRHINYPELKEKYG